MPDLLPGQPTIAEVIERHDGLDERDELVDDEAFVMARPPLTLIAAAIFGH